MSFSRPALFTFCIQLTLISAVPSPDLWDVNIYRGPAPPPDEGPPLSAGALRDPSKLKYEVIGIVGAYLLWVFLTLALVYSVARKLRQRAETARADSTTQEMKPFRQVKLTAIGSYGQDPKDAKSPKSPRKMLSWSRHSRGKASEVSLATTVDERVVESDRARNMDEMAMLYAAAMEHDEARSQKARDSAATSPVSPNPHRSPTYPPPEFQHLRTQPIAEEPTFGITQTAHDSRSESQPGGRDVRLSPISMTSTPSRSGSASTYKSRPSRLSIRGKDISTPIGTADFQNAAAYEDTVPLSPRLYNPGPAPPTPNVRETEKKLRPVLAPIRSSSANGRVNSLPFRQMYAESLQSAPATKTTFVDRRLEVLQNGPKTGVPYSPYTPFTPMTPVTPRRLMTKQDLKDQKKKRNLRALHEEDLVKADEDVWSNGI